MIFVRLTFESFRFAWNALITNPLRTILSLLGVTIGIFAIISVLTVVDSLERSIKDSFNFLGSNNINVEKWPYGLGGGQYPWWKYMQRPYPSYDEYEFLKENVKNAEAVCIYAWRVRVTSKYQSSSSTDNSFFGVVHSHKEAFEIPIEKGRYFSLNEVSSGRNVAIIGNRVANDLFKDNDPIGKILNIRGKKFHVIGIIKEEGDSFIGGPTNDEAIYTPLKAFAKVYHVGRRSGVESHITLKGREDDPGLVQLESELRGLMRGKRGLKPKEEDDFAINRPEAIVNFIGSTFDILGLAGWVIGGFSILVGGFGIANIMFVSVRERTNIIGIQKSLGAKNNFILFQFLFESVFLSVLGGAIGILIVWGLSFINLGTLNLVLSAGNVTVGLGVSIAIGTLSGIVPAMMGARMDPVLAIRTQ